MEDTRTVIDAAQEGQKEQKPKGEGWKLVDRFAGPLKEFERFSVFMFIMAVFFLAIGFVLGWFGCMFGYMSVQ